MDESRLRLLRRVYQSTLGLAGLALTELVVGGAYMLVYRYSRCNTNFLAPQDDDGSPRAAATQVLLCTFVLHEVASDGPFLLLTLETPDVLACTHEPDMARMRVYLNMTHFVFTFPSSLLGRDVRIFSRDELLAAVAV